MTGELTTSELEAVEQEADRLSQETWVSRRTARVVVMRSRGVSYREIAGLMGVETGTAKKQVDRLRGQYERRRDGVAFLSSEYRSVVDREFSK